MIGLTAVIVSHHQVLLNCLSDIIGRSKVLHHTIPLAPCSFWSILSAFKPNLSLSRLLNDRLSRPLQSQIPSVHTRRTIFTMTSKDPLPGGRFIPIGDEIFLGVRDTPRPSSAQEHASPEDPE